MYWVGIDLGGTGSRFLIADESGEHNGLVIPTSEFSTDAVAKTIKYLRELIGDREIAGIGIGASGPIDLNTGEIENPNTLPQFTEKKLAQSLATEFGVNCWIDNDTIVAALAENEWGLPIPSPSLLCITLGTGLGVAMLIDGRPVRGADGQHPEAGHIVSVGAMRPCYCGLDSCWEQAASRQALDLLRDECSEPELWGEYAKRLASGLLSLITVHHPAAISISGSVAQYWGQLREPLLAELKARPNIPVYASTLGAFGPALGATLLARHEIGFCATH